MRKFLLALVAFVSLSVTACSSKRPVGLSSRAEGNDIRATVAVRTGDQTTVIYSGRGNGWIEASTDPDENGRYVRTFGSWTQDPASTMDATSVNPAPAVAAPAPPFAPCVPVASPPPCDPAPASSATESPAVSAEDCRPVYTGCDGTAGGNVPTPRGTMLRRSSKPCVQGVSFAASAKETGGKVVGAVVGIPLHVGQCALNAVIGFVTCLASPL